MIIYNISRILTEDTTSSIFLYNMREFMHGLPLWAFVTRVSTARIQ